MGDVPKATAAVLAFAGAALWHRRRSRQQRAASGQLQAVRSSPTEARAILYAQSGVLVQAGSSGPAAQASALTQLLPFLFVAGLVVGATLYRPDLGMVSAVLLIPSLGVYQGRTWQKDADAPSTSGRRSGRAAEHQRSSAEQVAARLQSLNGSWIKDRERSDSMEPALQAMQLGKLVRSAVRLVKGIRIVVDADTFEMAVFSAIPWFKVVERYPLSGAAVKCKRRDLRRGQHTGRAHVTEQGDVGLTLAWQDPMGGTGTELFRLIDTNNLEVISTITVNGETIRYTNIHYRQ